MAKYSNVILKKNYVELGEVPFIVKRGIALGHKSFGQYIQVNRAKVEVISKLPLLISVNGVWSFLVLTNFYTKVY